MFENKIKSIKRPTVPPRIDAFGQPEEQVLKQGIRTRLLCGVSQGDKPLEFSWTKDGRPLSSSGLALPEVTIREVDADSSVLTFTNLSAVHTGHYQCAARNAAGLARQSAHLYVQGNLEIPADSGFNSTTVHDRNFGVGN